MAINERLIHTAAEAAAAGTGNQEDGLMLYYDANDVDSYDGDGSVWYDITNHEYTPLVNPAEHFNTALYTGNGGTQAITGVGFQPDLVWVKARNAAASHQIYDSVRGVHKPIQSNGTTGQQDYVSADKGVDSFDSDGFTVKDDSSGIYGVNGGSGGTYSGTPPDYVAWCFKAGGAPTATNTATSGAMTANSVSVDGTLQSAYTPSGSPSDYAKKMSVNTKLGFSIVETGTYGTTAKSFAHGLGVKPEMVIAKSINDAQDWYVWIEGFNQNEYLSLNDDDAKATISGLWGSSAPHDANVIDWHGSNGHEYVFYSFASKRGVSKVSSYTGTGSSGLKIYTGFQPAWVMVKESSAAGNWRIMDNARDTNNPKDLGLWANLTNSESSSSSNIVDFNADGFTIKGSGSDVNTSGSTYIYLAFAADKPSGLIDDTDLELHLDAGDDNSYNGSGSTWSDLANSYDGTISGASYDEELGDWFDFDGSNDYVSLSGNLNSSTKAFEIWLSPDSFSSDSWAFQQGDGQSVENYLRVYSGGLQVRMGNQTVTHTYSTTNKWIHVVGTHKTGNGFEFYLNGEKVQESTSSLTSLPNNYFHIGARRNASLSGYFNGKIGQVRVYSSALTQDQIRQNFNFTKNNYPNGLNGTFSGLTSSDWNSSGYFNFPTGSDRINLDFEGIDFNQTLVMWVNLGANTNINSNVYRYYLYSQYTGSNYQYFNISIYDKTSGGEHLNIAWRDSSSSYYFLEDDVDADFGSGWNMIAVYVSGTESVYYSINGNNWTQATLGYGDAGTENILPSGNVILSGYRGNTSILGQANPFSMSQLKVYDKVLTSSELSALNTAGYQG